MKLWFCYWWGNDWSGARWNQDYISQLALRKMPYFSRKSHFSVRDWLESMPRNTKRDAIGSCRACSYPDADELFITHNRRRALQFKLSSRRSLADSHRFVLQHHKLFDFKHGEDLCPLTCRCIALIRDLLAITALQQPLLWRDGS